MIYALVLLLLFSACAEEKPQRLSVQLFPARLAADARGPVYADWDTVQFAGDGQPMTYVIAPEPLLTDWNIIAFKAADQPDGSKVIAARLNAYSSKKMQAFCAEPGQLKQPLGLKVGERWVSFLPLLSPVQDRIQLRGFSAAEAARLQRDIEVR